MYVYVCVCMYVCMRMYLMALPAANDTHTFTSSRRTETESERRLDVGALDGATGSRDMH